MPPRLRLPCRAASLHTTVIRHACRYASAATASTITPAPLLDSQSAIPVRRYPPKQPPSHKPPEFRKSQLFRQYASMLYSTPFMLIFQHNNVRSIEWVAIRRELSRALQKVDRQLVANGYIDDNGTQNIKIHTIQTGIFAAALNVVEFYGPKTIASGSTLPTTASSAAGLGIPHATQNPQLTHALSQAANRAAQNAKKSRKHGLEVLLSGPLAVVAFPSVSPAHVAAALSILTPNSQFPAPKRKAVPSYHELDVQNGLQKLLLLGARVEGEVFDEAGTRWIGGIEGGIAGLRAQLVAMLQGFGGGLTTTLDSAARNLWLTVEGRRAMLEDEEGKGTEEKGTD